MARINGNNSLDADGMTMKAYLESKGYRLNIVAVELNGNILPKAQYESYIITESDTIEVVSFVGGG